MHSKIGRIVLHEKLQKYENSLNIDQELLSDSEIEKLKMSINFQLLVLQKHSFPELVKAEMRAYPRVSEMMKLDKEGSL